MTRTADQIAYQMATKHSPPGALAKSAGSTLRALWAGIAEEFARVYARVADFLREVFPSTTDELLEEWENELALPDPCVTTAQTLEDRHAAVVARASSYGGQTKPYLIDLAAQMGLVVSINDERPFLMGLSGMGDGIGGDEYKFTWTVSASASLTTAQRELLECTFLRVGPAWCVFQFLYI